MIFSAKLEQSHTVTVSGAKRWGIRAVIAGAALLAMSTAFAAQESSLDGSDGKNLGAAAFAQMMNDYLYAGATPQVKDAKFLFQECFGGGMVDALQSSFGNNTIKWIAGSASSATEPSWGPADPANGEPDRWTKALAPQLAKPNQKMGDTLQKAKDNDVAANRATNKETPQTAGSTGGTAGEGSDIKMSDGTSHHAIIWTGAKDAERHDNDITAVKNALTAAWGAPNGTTRTVTEVSTIDELKAAMDALKDAGRLNPNEEFFFYATDHGDRQELKTPATPIPSGGIDTEQWFLTPSELAAIFGSDPFHTAPVPTIEISYNSWNSGNDTPVSFNGHLVGNLNTCVSSTCDETFALDPAWLIPGNNQIQIDNSILTNSPFFLDWKLLDSGRINNSLDFVPEPGTMGLLATGLAMLAAGRRRRKRA